MMHFLRWFFVVCLFMSFQSQATLVREDELNRYIIKISEKDPLEIGKLSRWLNANNYDIAGTNWKSGEIEIITNQARLKIIEQFNFKGHILESPKHSLAAADKRYLNPSSLNQKMRELAQKFPHLSRVQEIGKTIQGRPILALLISTTPVAGDQKAEEKPSLLFDGEHHAREVMTPEIVFDIGSFLLNNYGKDEFLTHFINSWNIWLVPMVNPDGSNLVFSGKNMWRKNARESNGTMFGVDVNRNYAYNWNKCQGSSSMNWAQDYRGEFAGSEPETSALMALANTIRPSAYLSYHSYSELVLYPYGCRGALTPENDMIESVAEQMARLLPSDSGNGHYTPGSSWQLLYSVDGDSMGYMYAHFGALSYTLEVNLDFQPNYSLRDPTVLKHRSAWRFFMQHINDNLLTISVIDGRTNQDSEAMIEIDRIAHLHNEPGFRTNQRGRFFKVLDKGTYVITAVLPDGRSTQAIVNMSLGPKVLRLEIN